MKFFLPLVIIVFINYYYLYTMLISIRFFVINRFMLNQCINNLCFLLITPTTFFNLYKPSRPFAITVHIDSTLFYYLHDLGHQSILVSNLLYLFLLHPTTVTLSTMWPFLINVVHKYCFNHTIFGSSNMAYQSCTSYKLNSTSFLIQLF